MAVNAWIAYGGFVGAVLVGWLYQAIQLLRPVESIEDLPPLYISTNTDKQPMEETANPFWYGVFEEYD